MNSRYRPSEISVVSAPVTTANLRNVRNHPAIDLGCCTPFQMLANTGISHDGTVCIIGNPSRGIGVVKAMIRRSRKPFLLLGTASDRNLLSSFLEPDWVRDSAQMNLPEGNGALLFSKPYSSYLEMCEYMEAWNQNHFMILHLGSGLQIGIEILNLISSVEQCLIICDSVPQSIRDSETRTVTSLEFMKKMKYLLVFSSGVSSKDLVELLPTYQYEKVSNTTNFNAYKGRSILHPFRGHRGHGVSVGQTRTMEYKKSVFEVDDLKRIFDDGYMIAYNASSDSVFLAQIV